MKNDEIQPPMNNRHDDGKNLRRMVEDSLLSGRFESALCEIRMMNDPYDRAHYLAELVMTMDQAGKGDEAVTLYDEAVENICLSTRICG